MMRTNLGVVVLASVALLVAGCGGSSSSPGVAHLSTSTSSDSPASGNSSSSPESSASAQQKMVKFSQCMRTHGEPEFPEPTEGNIRDPQPERSRPEPRIVPVPGGRKGVQQVRALEGRSEPGAAGKDAGRRPELLQVHAQPRGPQLPRSGIPQRRRCRDTNRGQGLRYRSQLTAVQSRAESVPVRPARAEGRRVGGRRRTLHQLQRGVRRGIGSGRVGPVSARSFARSAKHFRNR